MTNQQRRTARGATRPAPGPRRRSAQSHERVAGRARPSDRRKKQPKARVRVNPSQPRHQAPRKSSSVLKATTKFTARAIIGLIILAVFVFGVFPTGSYVEQRNDLKEAERELAELQAENADLETRVERLGTDAEVEREARAEFNMSNPDEESYLILPPGQ